MKTRKTYFISDIHLSQNHPETVSLFLSFFAQCDTSTDSIYILGDLFEAYIGDDDKNDLQLAVINAIKNTSLRGIKVYYLHGNRDFLIGPHFLNESGCFLLAEESIVTIYGQQVLLMHGDTLCTNDHAYLRARRILQNPVSKWFFLKLPLSIRQLIANRLREKSKRYTKNAASDMMDVAQTTVENKMAAHHVDYLIHGHTHLPRSHQFTMQSVRHRWVLGAWHETAKILVWDQDQRMELIDIMNIQDKQP